MFIIKFNGQNHIWKNEINDDFLKFIPDRFDVDPNDMEVYYIPKSKRKLIKMENLESETKLHGEKMKKWPYDSQDKFLGFDLED